jgi:hypothetical protein
LSDQEFLAYPHDLTEVLFAYAFKHPEEFGTLLGQMRRSSHG